MLEKRFAAIAPQAFTADGTSVGVVTIANTSLFKVKQRIILASGAEPNLELEVKQVLSPTTMVVGPVTGSITAVADISAYLVSDGANVFANQQKRPTIIADEFERAVYDEEPTVAKRVVLVDEFGNKYNSGNKLPVDATFSGSITVGEVSQGDPNTLSNAWPVKVTDGTNPLVVNSDGSINVNIASSTSEPGLSIAHNEITSVGASSETTIITVTAPPGGQRVEKIEVSGDTVALFRVKVNGTTIVNKRSWWTAFNQTFDFENFVNGLFLTSGQVLTVTVYHDRPYLGAFEATIMSL